MKKSSYNYIVVEDIQEVCDEVKYRMDVFEGWNCIGLIAFYNEAFNLIISKKPDLLFLDYSIRGGNSFDLIEAVQKIDNYNPYIVFFTAYQNDQPEIPENALNKYRVNKYLVKPIFEKLTEHLQEYLKEAKQWIDANNTIDLWVETVDKVKIKIIPSSIICISQAANSRNKIIHTNENKDFEIKASWSTCIDIAESHNIDYFVSNLRESIINKAFITKIQKPFVWLNNGPLKIKVAKDKWEFFD